MTQFLPPNLLALFKPRDPIPYLPPVDKLPFEKRTAGYSGLAEFVQNFEDPATTPAPVKIRTREERRAEKRQQKAEATAYKLEQDIALWNPQKNPNATMDPYKTLFVARVNYDTSEAKLRREFEMYGPIKKIVLVHDLNRKPRGYAFIEYERERDMHSAYKHADGKKIEGKRVLVDVEKGRTVKGWLPRRLGGGLGGTRRGGPDVNLKHSGREENRSEDRYIDRDRDRLERPERRRSRSRSRERRERRERGERGKSRSRSRDRHRGDRHKRERSRDRDRGRDLAMGAAPGDVSMDGSVDVAPDGEPPRKERRRSRSRDRDRKRRRSRSRDRSKRHDRDRDRDRERRDRDSRRERGGEHEERVKEEPVEIKEEPVQENNYSNSGYEGEYNYNNGEPNAYEGY